MTRDKAEKVAHLITKIDLLERDIRDVRYKLEHLDFRNLPDYVKANVLYAFNKDTGYLYSQLQQELKDL